MYANRFLFSYKQKNHLYQSDKGDLGDPYGNRTHVTAVKGRCLNRLTNGPHIYINPCKGNLSILFTRSYNDGSGNWIRTNDTAGMNRML